MFGEIIFAFVPFADRLGGEERQGWSQYCENYDPWSAASKNNYDGIIHNPSILVEWDTESEQVYEGHTSDSNSSDWINSEVDKQITLECFKKRIK